MKDLTKTWHTAGGDNGRRGCFDGRSGLGPGPERRLSAPAAIQAAIVFDGAGTAFVADMSGAVQAVNRKGILLWRAALGEAISASPAVDPAVARLFVGTHAGRAYALDSARGAVIWQHALPTKSDPRILSDLLYLSGPDLVVLSSWGGRFWALAGETGAERFSWDAGVSPGSAASADTRGNIYCLRAAEDKGTEFVRVSADGKETVLYAAAAGKEGARRTLVAAAPVIDPERGVVYFMTNQDQAGLLHAWSLKTSSLLWTHPFTTPVQATPAVLENGSLLVADLGGFVQALNPEGVLQYRYASGCEYLLAGGVGEAGGSFFFGDPLGQVHELNPQGTGRVVFEAKRAIQARPAFDPDGRLYVPCTDRTVYIFPPAH